MRYASLHANSLSVEIQTPNPAVPGYAMKRRCPHSLLFLLPFSFHYHSILLTPNLHDEGLRVCSSRQLDGRR